MLHDAFAVPLDEIAHVVDRSPQTTKKLASRARLKVRGGATLSRVRRGTRTAAARRGRVPERRQIRRPARDHRTPRPDVVRRAAPAARTSGRPIEVRGADTVAKEITLFGQGSRHADRALINGATVGILVARRGRLHLVPALTINADSGPITAYELVADPARLFQLDLTVLDVPAPDRPHDTTRT